ncbi:hypothetical protein B9479_005256 [Cryptococcus floricola]|uniref:Flavin reductase like domain-containing protein n=1 Tax=Cryptococcus floricola TaxID=2591691 RepID=A0A5D3AVG3_9TREE|nr:hypothetical protein B9479_005256 [Cryptococcus floricola]
MPPSLAAPMARCIPRSARYISSNTPGADADPAILLRQVMRNVAQPVAVAVASVPPSSPLAGVAAYHGATLTSFTSLTLHPRPLVAFSLRLPSRMADCLRPWRTGGGRDPELPEDDKAGSVGAASGDSGLRLPPKSDLPWPLSKLPMPEDPPIWAQSLFSQIPNPLSPPSNSSSLPPSSKMVGSAKPVPPTPLTISLLSTSNSAIADALAQPRTDHSSIFSLPDTWVSPSPSSPAHPPSLKGCVGSLQCQVVGSVMLGDLCEPGEVDGAGSEMFICRVVGVEMDSEVDEDSFLPLLHWRRKYAGVKELE